MATKKRDLDNLLENFKAQPVLPGDDVTEAVTAKSRKVAIGPGLLHVGDKVIASRSGTLRYTSGSPDPSYFVESGTIRRYVPRKEDCIVGIVEDRSSTSYRIGVSATMPGMLPILAFQGATKRTKPIIKVGDAVYARVVSAPRDMEPELSCISVYGSRKGWETGEATFGPLEGGTLLRCSLSQAESLRKHDHPVMLALQEQGSIFEIVIGANGIVWVKAGSPALTIGVANAVQNSLVCSPNEIPAMVKMVFDRMRDNKKAR